MKIVFDEKAISDLQSIREWIARDSRTRAGIVLDRIFQTIDVLHRFPRRGRPGLHPETHELIVRGLPYLVVFEVREGRDELFVTAVLHMARDRSSLGR